MSRTAVLTAFLALAAVPCAHAADPKGCPQEASAVAATPFVSPELAALFQTSPEVAVTANGMKVTKAPVRLWMLARRASDGSIVLRCVDSAEAAQKFLRAPDVQPAGKAREK